jgi:hypothetical protein
VAKAGSGAAPAGDRRRERGGRDRPGARLRRRLDAQRRLRDAGGPDRAHRGAPSSWAGVRPRRAAGDRVRSALEARGARRVRGGGRGARGALSPLGVARGIDAADRAAARLAEELRD